MVTKPSLCVATFVLFSVMAVSAAEAQNLAGSFEQLQVLVKPGDTISVTDTTGHEFTGRITSLSSSSLALMVQGVRRDLSEGDITTIRQNRQDSLANGAKWGLGIGAALGLSAGVAIASGDGSASALIPILGAVYGGLGAGVGAGLDALIQGNQVIYYKPNSAAKLSVSPLITSTRKGVMLSFGF
jgi:hypothetical protein